MLATQSVAAVRGGAMAGGARESSLTALTHYARNLGLAFQITDDLLDLQGDPETLGKDTHRDTHRANFATILGTESCRQLVAELLDTAVAEGAMPPPVPMGQGRHIDGRSVVVHLFVPSDSHPGSVP